MITAFIPGYLRTWVPEPCCSGSPASLCTYIRTLQPHFRKTNHTTLDNILLWTRQNYRDRGNDNVSTEGRTVGGWE